MRFKTVHAMDDAIATTRNQIGSGVAEVTTRISPHATDIGNRRRDDFERSREPAIATMIITQPTKNAAPLAKK